MKLQYYIKFLSFFRSEMKRLLDQVVSDLVFRNYGPPMSPSMKASWVDPNCTGWLSTISESPSSPILLTLGSGEQKQPFVNPHPPPQSLSQPLATSTPQVEANLPQGSNKTPDHYFEIIPLNISDAQPSVEHQLSPEQNETLDLIEEMLQEEEEMQVELSSSPPQAQPIPALNDS